MSILIELTTIFLLSIFQSVFGIGLLLVGTPFFLFLDYSFLSTLSLLLPTSITISFMQFIYSKKIDKVFVADTNKFCLPLVIIFIYLTLSFKELINFKYWVTLLLILSSLIIILKPIFLSFLNKLKTYRKPLFVMIGIIHGVTNMGGSFLSLFSSSISGGDKILTRQYISYGYLSMGLIQYLSIMFLYFDKLNYSYILYAFIGVLVYFPSQRIYFIIMDEIYVGVIGFLSLSFGVFLLLSYYF